MVDIFLSSKYLFLCKTRPCPFEINQVLHYQGISFYCKAVIRAQSHLKGSGHRRVPSANHQFFFQFRGFENQPFCFSPLGTSSLTDYVSNWFFIPFSLQSVAFDLPPICYFSARSYLNVTFSMWRLDKRLELLLKPCLFMLFAVHIQKFSPYSINYRI